MRSNRLLSITAILAIALFAVTFIELFDARVQSGDVYPVYSSLRSDAGGTKAYYDSINRIRAAGSEPPKWIDYIPARGISASDRGK
jgi:hypothetical protein